ncbi:hypothetical protein [Tardiphaga sp. 803_E3_N1_3]|uniref:hypothetical protein n=1 Tax=Tardiphaga sp. 803_E3_N1_3 TaxID=3240785 RepID=UPI003F29DB36
MSPVTFRRRYVVRFTYWELYGTVVVAANRREALEKARASYEDNGLLGFTTSVNGEKGWSAEYVGQEDQS